MNWEITKAVIMAIFRGLIGIAGSWLVKKGFIDQGTADAWANEVAIGLLGLVLIAIPIGWQILVSRFNVLALLKAVQTDPPADTKPEIAAAVAEVKQEVKADPRLTISL